MGSERMSALSTNNSPPFTHHSQLSWLNRFAIFTSFCTFLLIVAGALVTSTGSGLSVPDWPLSFGQFFPPMKGGVFFEHGHRMIAGTVAILITILALWLWRREERRWLCWLGSAALGTVFLQALLGGITVLYRLPPSVSIAHAILAQTFFCLTVSLAFFTSPILRAPAEESVTNPDFSRRFRLLSLTLTCLIFVQLILGATVRHGGENSFLYAHIFGAVIVAVSAGGLVISIFRTHKHQKELLFLSIVLHSLLMVQIFLGLISAFPDIAPFLFAQMRTVLVTLHVACGALILAASLIITLRSFSFFPHKDEGKFLNAPLSEPPSEILVRADS